MKAGQVRVGSLANVNFCIANSLDMVGKHQCLHIGDQTNALLPYILSPWTRSSGGVAKGLKHILLQNLKFVAVRELVRCLYGTVDEASDISVDLRQDKLRAHVTDVLEDDDLQCDVLDRVRVVLREGINTGWGRIVLEIVLRLDKVVLQNMLRRKGDRLVDRINFALKYSGGDDERNFREVDTRMILVGPPHVPLVGPEGVKEDMNAA